LCFCNRFFLFLFEKMGIQKMEIYDESSISSQNDSSDSYSNEIIHNFHNVAKNFKNVESILFYLQFILVLILISCILFAIFYFCKSPFAFFKTNSKQQQQQKEKKKWDVSHQIFWCANNTFTSLADIINSIQQTPEEENEKED
jgi:hypothetical protein